MAHKTLVGGTAYGIKGGKALVGGTAYGIKKGRTLVGGTGYDIKFGPSIGDPLSDFTPEQIQEIAQTGDAPNYWSVGDMVPITLNGPVSDYTFNNETYYAFIIGFNHNSSKEGSNTVHFQFGKTSAGVDIAFCSNFANQYGGKGFYMNYNSTNSGGWRDSYMRSTICPAFLAAMPVEWQSVIADCTKYSNFSTPTSDKIWLLSEFEVYGTNEYANSYYEVMHHKQYDYYKAGNSKIKYQHGYLTSPARWWLRSMYNDDDYSFCMVYSDSNGNVSVYKAAGSYGLAPGFMVA